jgi:hypothetical protein
MYSQADLCGHEPLFEGLRSPVCATKSSVMTAMSSIQTMRHLVASKSRSASPFSQVAPVAASARSPCATDIKISNSLLKCLLRLTVRMNYTRHRFAVDFNNQNIRWLKIPMNDRFLVGVLHALAGVDKKF